MPNPKSEKTNLIVRRSAFGVRLFLGALLATPLGCTRPQARGQREEESDRERYPVKLVGDVTTFSNADPIPVHGVGLVEDLDSTGGPVPAGGLRDTLEHDLLQQRVPDVKALLRSDTCAMVLVAALVPPGARKGDRIDVEVRLPPGSRATSLRGGRLRRCVLYNHEFLGNVSAQYAGTNAALKGHPIALAEGNLLVGFGSSDEGERMKSGRIWEGAVSRIDRPFHLLMNVNQQFARVAANVADRINTAFQGAFPGGPDTEIASAKTNTFVLLGMPPQYKHNPQRFLRVVRMVPLEDGEVGGPRPGRPPYRVRLQEDLLDPARTVVASLRLEGLGTASIPALKQGLQSPHPLVRFCSAEALAYLGNAACADELARTVQQQPYLRAYALTALASLDESVCRDRLFDLLSGDGEDETRYGAFRALRALNERDEAVRGKLLGDAFWLHHIAPNTPPLVHVSLSRRPEVVLFGSGHALVPPFSLLAGEFAVTAAAGDQRCTVSHFPLHGDEEGGSRVRCPLELTEVLKLMASQGASFAEVIELLRQADLCRSLSCRLRHDALPQTVTVQQLAEAGRADAEKKRHPQPGAKPADAIEIIKPDTADLGATPALYQEPTSSRPAALDNDARTLQHERRGPSDERASRWAE
ncbi:MAG: flagellar basal body P-ring protein FlgI [Planctomycetes bacterium]|nr:flagellar basal body P-ring protein FlgI [Planctomycetota bacterium]